MNACGHIVRKARYRAGLVVIAFCACFGALGASAASGLAAQVEWEQGLGLTKTARLSAQINPEGVDTVCHVEYVSSEAFALSEWREARTVGCDPEDLGSGATGKVSTAELNGLELDRTYEFRFRATAGSSTASGPAETFNTFGVEEFAMGALTARGLPYDQAGGHPYALTTKLVFNSSYLSNGEASADARLKDVNVALPPGLVGDPAAVARCSQRLEEIKKCPGDSQIGIIGVRLMGDAKKGKSVKQEEELSMEPLYNLVPPEGVAVRFGGIVNAEASAFINASVRSGSDYGVNVDSLEITPFAVAKRIVVTVWGEPASSAHDAQRVCPKSGPYEYIENCGYEGEAQPFLREPTSCSGPLSVPLVIDSYQEPDEPVDGAGTLPEVTGCGEVPFAAGIAEAQSTTSMTDSPTGLKMDLHVSQTEEAGISSSDVKNATVTLPPGMVVNPSSADGLGVCSEEAVGFTGFAQFDPEREPGVSTPQFTATPAKCPSASKLGTVQIDTPLLNFEGKTHPLDGAIYLAAPHQNPFGSLLAVYLAVYDPITGIVVKLPGLIHADAATGQIAVTFRENPQLPFEDIKVDLFGGPGEARASLTTPETCGSYAVTGMMEPWSGNPAVSSFSPPFEINQTPSGGTCPGSEDQAGNSPGFQAGTVTPVADGFSGFTLRLSREDGSQRLQALNVTLPPGLTAKIAGVQECPESDIQAAEALGGEEQGAVEQAQPSCPTASEIGLVHVGAGSGVPFYVTGRAYFAGPYKGAPFSIVIVTPAIAGPFDLGTVVVRSALQIDPATAQGIIESDPFPAMLDGIPLDIRRIYVEITRPGFILNPTSCSVMAVTGQSISTAGSTAPLSSRFQVGGCGKLPFEPVFEAFTRAHHTRRYGAYLRVTAKSGLGQANIKSVKVQLPVTMPARESALKGACSEQQYASDPAGCPAASRVGYAVAHTPLLPVALSGPVIFVSHGGAAFPELDVVLQGDGVTVDLTSHTNISKGITSSSFNTLPDVPVNAFELTLPQGPDAALAAESNLCYRTVTKRVRKRVHGRTTYNVKKVRKRRRLIMPTVITGQNGAQIKKSTTINVVGCAEPRRPSHKQRSDKK